MFRFPFIRVPDFREEIKREEQPSYVAKMSERELDEYLSERVWQRSILWACHHAAVAYNIAILISLVLFLPVLGMLLFNGRALLLVLLKYLTP